MVRRQVGSAPSRSDPVLWASYSLLLVFGLSVGLPGPAVPSLQSAYGLTYSGAALHLTVFSIGSALGSALDGQLGRRFSRVAVLRAALLGVAVGAAVSGLAPVAAVSLVGIVLMGFCATIAMNIAHGVIGAAYGDERSTVLAYGHLLAAVGLVLAAIAVAAARSVDQWRLAFVAPIAAIALILLWNLPGRLPTRAREATTDRVTYAAVPAAVWIGGVVLALSVGVEWAVTFWAASFLRDPVGLRPAYADATTVAVLAALVIGRWVLGRLTVRYAANRLLRVALVVVGAAAVPYLLGARLEDPYGAIVAVAGLGTLCLTITMLFPLALVATMGAVGGSAAEQQRASAAALLIGALGAVVTPYLLGAVADATTLTTALLMIPVGSALAMVSLALMHRSTDRQLVRAQR